jgi:hypothetical protein
MKYTIPYIVIAIVLFGAAALAWRESQSLHVRADTHERFATLRFDDVDDPIARYWRGEFAALATVAPTGEEDASAETLLVRANAAFRAGLQKARTREDQVKQLDVVLQSYATVLKAPVYLADAAYNYEYVARVREGLTRPRAATLPPPDALKAGDLPGGPTIHGRPGGPPPASKGEEFQIITPMEYGDRETQPEPNPGGKPLRKG